MYNYKYVYFVIKNVFLPYESSVDSCVVYSSLDYRKTLEVYNSYLSISNFNVEFIFCKSLLRE